MVPQARMIPEPGVSPKYNQVWPKAKNKNFLKNEQKTKKTTSFPSEGKVKSLSKRNQNNLANKLLMDLYKS